MSSKKIKIIDEQKHNSVNNLRYRIIFEKTLGEKLACLESEMCDELNAIAFKRDKNIAAVYNPIEYAQELHKNYIEKYLKKTPKVLFLGMNPGLFGMCQTGVPFGNVSTVRDWMKLSGTINQPTDALAVRPIEGLTFKREEQSGIRFWGVIQSLCDTPEQFFNSCYVHNICPLAFLNSSGRNITPPEIKGNAKLELKSIVIKYLIETLILLKPVIIVNVGSYVNEIIKNLEKKKLLPDHIIHKLLPHPSPRALNNHNWVEKATKWFDENDILKYFNEP